MAYLSQAFAIASFALSIIAIFVPVFGIFMAGLSGILAWGSYGRLVALGFAAPIINILNILLLSPTYLVLLALETSQRAPDQSMTLRIWMIVFSIQVIALVLLISNMIVFRLFMGGNKRKNLTPKQTLPKSMQSEDTDTGTNNQMTKQSQSSGPYIPQPPGRKTETTNDITGILSSRNYENQEGEAKVKDSDAKGDTGIIEIDEISKQNKGQFSPIYVFGTLFLLGVIIWGVFNLAFYDKPYVPLSRVYEDIQNSSKTLPDLQEPNVSTQELVISEVKKETPLSNPHEEQEKIEPNTTITQEMLDDAWGDLKPEVEKPEQSSQPIEQKKSIGPKVVSIVKTTEVEDKLYYYYAIKLKTGERIITKNAIIHEDAVDYIDRNGNMTSIDRNLINSLKRYYYKQKN